MTGHHAIRWYGVSDINVKTVCNQYNLFRPDEEGESAEAEAEEEAAEAAAEKRASEKEPCRLLTIKIRV